MQRAVTAVGLLVAISTWGLASAKPVQAQEAGIVAGTLTCDGRGSIGAIIGSRQRLSCVFNPVGGSPRQSYSARITRLGLDVGIKGPSRMIWTVLGPSSGLQRGALEGTFAGVGANASVGVGGGANVLVGGSHNAIVLQPLSVQAQTGLNVAAGVAGLRLTYRGR
jgi:Protein of unknown function (DUF992)